MQRKIKYLRKRLGIPSSFISAGFYIRLGLHQLLSLMVEEFKVAKCRVLMTYIDSQDAQVRHAGVNTRAECKWASDTSAVPKRRTF